MILPYEPLIAHPFTETPLPGRLRAVELADGVGEMHLHVAVEIVGTGELAGATRENANKGGDRIFFVYYRRRRGYIVFRLFFIIIRRSFVVF